MVIKYSNLLLVALLVCFSLTDCEEEKAHPRDYPRVRTLPVSNITAEGATFRGDLYSLGTEPIKEYGFVWGPNIDPGLESDKVILPGANAVLGIFTAEIRSTLKEGTEYTVKSYVKTDSHVVYGTPLAFVSLGSLAPVITGFSPDSAAWMDVIKISGRNFSWVPNNNTVKLGQVSCMVNGSTDTTLSAIVNYELNTQKSLLSVEVAGNVSTFSTKDFVLKLPHISNISPAEGSYGDTIMICGRNFLTSYGDNVILCKIGGLDSKVIIKKSDTLAVVVPDYSEQIINQIDITIGGHIFTCPVQFKLISPPLNIESINPKEGIWGTTIVIKGKFHPQVTKNQITIGGIKATIESFSPDSVKISVPTDLFTENNKIVNTVTPFTFESPEPFRLLGPEIESITPGSAFGYEEVVITGRRLYFPVYGEWSNHTVMFGTKEANMSDISDTRIICTVPPGLSNGPVKVSVNVRSLVSTFSKDFMIKAPVITKLTPLTASFNDVIIIEGENLCWSEPDFNRVYFNQPYSHQATIVESHPNKLVVNVPIDLDSIPGKVFVEVYGNMGSSVQDFTLLPPEITSISAPVFDFNRNITIYGKNFNPEFSRNKVFWGNYPLVTTNATAEKIEAEIPAMLPGGNNRINIIVGGYKRNYPQLYEVKSPWLKIELPQSFVFHSLGSYNNRGGISFSLKGTGYLLDVTEPVMTSYNPATNEFVTMHVVSQFFAQYGLSWTTNNDTLYIIGRQDTGLQRYEEATTSWKTIGVSPSNAVNGILLALNGNLYYGLGYYDNSFNLQREMWYYDLKMNAWFSKSPFPEYTSSLPVAYFSIGNKGYVLFANNIFCEYNPQTDTWTKLASYPADVGVTGLISFVIDGKGYAGLGSSAYGTQFDMIWQYDPAKNEWSEFTSMPNGPRYNAVSFVINKKVYIGFGYNPFNYSGNNLLNDLYEFDPDYPVK